MAAARQHTFVYLNLKQGKIVRQAQNARAYAKRHGRRGPQTTTKSKDLLNPLASSISHFATLPLPDSYLFQQSLSGSNLIDDSDLSQWDKSPPYDCPSPPDSPEEERFTHNLFHVMHGRLLRLERDSHACHAARYDTGEIAEILKELQDTQRRLIGGWDELNSRVTNMQACARHKLMAQCYCQGVARRILTYQKEVDLLVAKQNPYFSL
ncbi:hypothetical protein F4604DRAFT_1924473 [Suillus subluteus]|nr:hypothetical protein F4604DRAFT_1924473 [Suillus subluteus]